ncbi:MAG: hypothetical protein ABI330_13215 [Caldimonas sp.]
MLLVAFGAAACASMAPRTVDVSQARLQELIARRFPVKRRLLEAIDITVDSPHLTLQPESNRIAVDLLLDAGNAGAATSNMTGSLRVTEGLRFEASDNTVRLVDVHVERFVIDGLPLAWQRELDRVGKPLAKALLDDAVLYALRPQDIAGLEDFGVRPGDLRVTDSGLRITLLPNDR